MDTSSHRRGFVVSIRTMPASVSVNGSYCVMMRHHLPDGADRPCEIPRIARTV